MSSQSEGIMLEICDVSKSFKNQIALSHVSLQCEGGKIYGFVGYNGSGKTVLFKCICGLLIADSGSVVFNGKKIGDETIKDAGIIIEEPAFIRNETGRKNLELLYMMNHKRDESVITHAMERVGLDAASKKKVKEYSLGMRQRLALAQAMMENPNILILDEPMNGLDKAGVAEVRQILLELKKQGKLILLASHNKEDIEILCDEVYEMEKGQLTNIKSCDKNEG